MATGGMHNEGVLGSHIPIMAIVVRYAKLGNLEHNMGKCCYGNLRLHRAGDAIYHIPYTSSAKRYTYLNRMVSKCVHILADSSTNMMFLL